MNESEEAPSITILPEGCISDIISVTSPRDASRFAAISKTFNTAADSDAVWERFLPSDYREIIARAVSHVGFDSKKQLYLFLSDSHILLDHGRLAFKLDKESGKKCYMLGARDLSIAWQDDTRYWEWGHVPGGSRFAEVGILKEVWWLDIRGIIDSALLSQKSTYVAYLVYQITRGSRGLSEPAKTIVTFGGIRNETSIVYLQQPRVLGQEPAAATYTMRNDGWMEIELGEFYCNDGNEGEVEMVFHEHVHWKSGLIVEGIQLRPK